MNIDQKITSTDKSNDARVTIAVDCGGTHIKAALLNNGNVIASEVLPNNNEASDLNIVVECSMNLCNRHGFSKKHIIGMGLSLPGIVDHRQGKLVSINGKYEWGVDFDFGQWARENFFSLPVVVENDARLALLGETETSYGAARGFKNAVLFMLGTGIGTSAIVEGVLLRGAHNQAGILGGHMACDIHGFSCTCGNIGCVEGQVATWRLPDLLRSRPGFETSVLHISPNADAQLDYKALMNAYKQSDEFAVSVVGDIAKLWGVGVINLVHAYDPQVVVFSGGIMRSADIIVPLIVDYVEKHAWIPWGKLTFVTAHDVTSSALLGAEALLKKYLNVSL